MALTRPGLTVPRPSPPTLQFVDPKLGRRGMPTRPEIARRQCPASASPPSGRITDPKPSHRQGAHPSRNRAVARFHGQFANSTSPPSAGPKTAPKRGQPANEALTRPRIPRRPALPGKPPRAKPPAGPHPRSVRRPHLHRQGTDSASPPSTGSPTPPTPGQAANGTLAHPRIPQRPDLHRRAADTPRRPSASPATPPTRSRAAKGTLTRPRIEQPAETGLRRHGADPAEAESANTADAEPSRQRNARSSRNRAAARARGHQPRQPPLGHGAAAGQAFAGEAPIRPPGPQSHWHRRQAGRLNDADSSRNRAMASPSPAKHRAGLSVLSRIGAGAKLGG